MAYRLNEGFGLAFYQVGVLDSGQVTGLSDQEILETMIIIYYMSTTLNPRPKLEIAKVRVGHEGFSVMMQLTQEKKQTVSDLMGQLKIESDEEQKDES
jgi:GTPase